MYVIFLVILCAVSSWGSCPVMNGKKSKGITAIESYLISSADELETTSWSMKRLPGQHQDHYSELNMAILEHSTQRVGELLAQDPSSANALDEEESSLLQWAAMLGYSDIVNILLAFGADPDGNGSFDFPPLHLACILNHTDVVTLMLDNGASVNLDSMQGLSPLHHAVDEGLSELSEMLLERGAAIDQVETKSHLQLSPLQIAAMRGEKDLTHIMTAHGASGGVKSQVGHTALIFAAAAQHGEIVNMILELDDTDSWINAMDETGCTALIYAIMGEPGSDRGHLIPGFEREWLPRRGSEPRRGTGRPQQYRGPKLERSPWESAEKEENIAASIVESLLRRGADPNLAEYSLMNSKTNIPDAKKNSRPPLFHAIRLGYPKVIKLLLNYGAILPKTSKAVKNLTDVTSYPYMSEYVKEKEEKELELTRWDDLSYYLDWAQTMNQVQIQDLFVGQVRIRSEL